MVYRTNGYLGCLILIIVMMIFFTVIRFTGWVIFGTPVGLVLLGYIVYRYFKKNKEQEVSKDYYEEEPNFNNDNDIVDVDYEDLDE